jgi:hypothetical protein
MTSTWTGGISMNLLENLVEKAIKETQSTLRKGETLFLNRERITILERHVEEVIEAINQQNTLMIYLARSEKSYKIIQTEGLLNTKAASEVKGNGRHDRYPLGSLYFRFDPDSTEIAILYRKGYLLRETQRKRYIVIRVSMTLTGKYEEDYVVVPSVSDPRGTNFIIRDVINCKTGKLLKIPYIESRFERVGEFLYTLDKALAMFPDLPVHIIRDSFDQSEERSTHSFKTCFR